MTAMLKIISNMMMAIRIQVKTNASYSFNGIIISNMMMMAARKSQKAATGRLQKGLLERRTW
jgi:nitrogen fixation protein FixH